MKEFVSPKQAALAMGVSESSLKRWCDRGLLSTVKTGGGHRRIAVADVVRFIRETRQQLHQPALLGLELERADIQPVRPSIEHSLKPFTEALKLGDESRAVSLATECYLQGISLVELADRLITPAFHTIGEEWSCERMQVYEERRACEVCLRIIHQLRRLLGNPPLSGYRAIGGTLSGDFYQIATSLVELTLREAGWQAENLGSGIPFESLRAAVMQQEPRLLWVSVSHIDDPEAFKSGMDLLWETCERQQVALLIGGRELSDEWRRTLKYSSCAETFTHVRTFAASLQPVLSPTLSDR